MNDENWYSQRLRTSIFIDFRYQSSNCYWLISITIDFIDYRILSIGQAGKKALKCSCQLFENVWLQTLEIPSLLTAFPTTPV